jgi:hypothetical protein
LLITGPPGPHEVGEDGHQSDENKLSLCAASFGVGEGLAGWFEG